MRIYNWLFIILLVLIGYSAYKHIKWMYPSNKLLLKVKRVSVKGSLTLWFVILIFYTLDCVQEITSSYQLKYSGSIDRSLLDRIDVNIIWIIISLMYIIKQYKSREIRENGITTSRGFIGWKDIKTYNWISGGEKLVKKRDGKGKERSKYDRVELAVNREWLFSNKEVKIIWDVISEQKEEVEELLNSHIKIDKNI